ncbi:hypothetical protein L1987_48433 [Smallanthus sonchifolius]|uniref:Uncharacterized protein n=1 Tax=Smallanthus sonchifolius TaxID=185202 RepID=A0ACB9FRM2_9ASTR|nr:hypothetical protein L1987_48433 [Smallanthus sonchifolius]
MIKAFAILVRHDCDHDRERHHRHRSRSASPDRSRESSRSRSKRLKDMVLNMIQQHVHNSSSVPRYL